MIKVVNYTERAEIYIYGVIIDDTDAMWIKTVDEDGMGYEWPEKIRKQLEDIAGKPVDVHIASDGGNVSAGIAIFNLLKNHTAPVTVYIDSWAASIASVIAMVADKVVMPENTFLMIHNPMGGARGDASYLRSVADWLDKLREIIAETYARRVIVAPDEKRPAIDLIKELMDRETWFTAREAADIFTNVVLEPSNDVEAVACYKSEFKNAPEAIKGAGLNKPANDLADNNNEFNDKIFKVLQEAFKL